MPPSPLRDRLASVGEGLAAREREHRVAVEEAWTRAEALRAEIAEGLKGYEEAIAKAGAPQLAVDLGPVRTDEKHVRAVEFELARGRHRALFIVKSRGEITLVGPFRTGKPEGPCQSVAWDSRPDLDTALGGFIEKFLEEAATP